MLAAADPHDPHALTLATARGRRLCKLRHADGRVEEYDSARRFDLVAARAPDLAALAGLLHALVRRHDTCVLRGAIRDPAGRACGVRRLLHPDPETGDEPTLVEAPRAWLALDFDGLPLPADVDPRDLRRCGALARAVLPVAFHGAGCIVGATAGHGFKADARLRLWFLLRRPLSGAECRRWLAAAPVDRAIFGAAQPIYTAAPVFAGMADPLPERLALLAGEERVTPPSATALAPPPRMLAAPSLRRIAGDGGPARYAAAALARAAATVAAAPVKTRHPTALREAWSLARFVRAGLLTEAEVREAIGAALEAAGKTRGEGETLAAWAVAHRADAWEAGR